MPELEEEAGGAAVVLGFWKSLRMSTLLSLGVGEGIGALAATGDDVDGLDCFEDAEPARVDAKEGGLPLTGELAGTDPKDLTPSDFMGATGAGEEDIGAASSSMEPKVTAGESERDIVRSIVCIPCLAGPTLLRTPSFMDTPLRALGRLE